MVCNQLVVPLAFPGHIRASRPAPPGSTGGGAREHEGGETKNGVSNCLLLHFYRPPSDDVFINRAVSWVDGPFSHVEIGWDDGMASSIYAGEQVFMHQRRFANPNYTVVPVQVSGDQADKARKFCCDKANAGIGFDAVGMYTSRLPFVCRKAIALLASVASRKRVDSTFCSKYVTEVLQHISMPGFSDFDPSNMSPSSVHRAVTSLLQSSMGSSSLVATTPYKRELLSSDRAILWA